MDGNVSAPIVRQYFEHPPRSHLYQGSPTGASPVLDNPLSAVPGVHGGGRAAHTPDAVLGTAPQREKAVLESPLGAATEGDGPTPTPLLGEASPPPPRQALSTLLLVGLMYTFTMSGAYGIEESVMGGGVLLTVVSVLVIPLVMGGPTALVVAELASAVPSNAGFLMWIKLSFHRAVYLAMGIMSVIYVATDNALYPTLFSEYFCTAVECSKAGAIWLRLGMLAFTFLLNVFGVETVGVASVVLTALTVLPFVLMFVIQQVNSGFYINWPAMVYVPTDSMKWAEFLSTASWCLSGLEQAGTVVEDVADPQRTIIGSLIPLLGLAVVTYIPPIITGASVTRGPIDLSVWTTGYWAEVSDQVGGTTLKLITVLGSFLSSFGLTLSALCTTTRILYGMALTEAFPGKVGEWLSYRSPRYGTYPWALALNTVLTAVLSTAFDFGPLVRIDQCLYGIRVIVILMSFYRIRQLYPHLDRPFRIPLTGWKLHLMMGVALVSSVILTIVSAMDWFTAKWCAVVVAASFAAAYGYCHFFRQHDFLGRVVTEVRTTSVEDTSPTAAAFEAAHAPRSWSAARGAASPNSKRD